MAPLQIAKAPAGKLVLVGGGVKPLQALQYFTGESGKPVLVVNWASEVGPESYDRCRVRFEAVGIMTVASITPPQSKAERAEFLQYLENARGMFFGGGDQNRIMDFLESAPEINDAIRRAHRQGKTMGGTSAGTAIASPWMISGDTTCLESGARGIEMRRGMGFLPGTVVDQHFFLRGRHHRLFQALAKFPDHLGVGIDENAAAVIHNDEFLEAIHGQTMLVHLRGRTLHSDILEPGETYDLNKRTRICEETMPHPRPAQVRG